MDAKNMFRSIPEPHTGEEQVKSDIQLLEHQARKTKRPPSGATCGKGEMHTSRVGDVDRTLCHRRNCRSCKGVNLDRMLEPSRTTPNASTCPVQNSVGSPIVHVGSNPTTLKTSDDGDDDFSPFKTPSSSKRNLDFKVIVFLFSRFSTEEILTCLVLSDPQRV